MSAKALLEGGTGEGSRDRKPSFHPLLIGSEGRFGVDGRKRRFLEHVIVFTLLELEFFEAGGSTSLPTGH